MSASYTFYLGPMLKAGRLGHGGKQTLWLKSLILSSDRAAPRRAVQLSSKEFAVFFFVEGEAYGLFN